MENPLCRCGCNQPVIRPTAWFIAGHHSRVRTQKTIEKIRQKAIEQFRDPAQRKKQRQAAKERFEKPEEHEKLRVASAKRWAKQEEHEKIFRREYSPHFDLLTGEELGYLAGFFEAEGSFGFIRHEHIQIKVTNTNIPVLKWLEKKTGIGNVATHRNYGNHFGNKQVYEWVISADEHCRLLLRVLKPFLDYQGGNVRHPPITKVNWGFVAGFFDGEGSINFEARSCLYRLSMTQKEREVLDAIQRFIGYGVVYGPYRGNPFRLLINSHEDQHDFIDHVSRFAVVKKERLLQAREFIISKDWGADNKLRDVPLELLMAEYRKLRSIRKVAAKHRVTYNAIHDKFERTRVEMQLPGTNQFGSPPDEVHNLTGRLPLK